MKKIAITLVIISFALLTACSSTSTNVKPEPGSPQAVHQLRPSITWGLSIQQVRAIEKDLKEIESDGNILVMAPVAFYDTANAKVAYFFHNDRLSAVVYLIDDTNIKPADYFSKYEQIKADITRKSAADPEENRWRPTDMPETHDARVEALRQGHLSYQAYWHNVLTLLKLENINGRPAITVQFSNTNTADEVRETMFGGKASEHPIMLPDNVTWDISQQTLRGLKSDAPVLSENGIMLYRTENESFDILTAYTFIDDKLGMIDNYFILEDGSPQNYIQNFEGFVNHISQFYGPSSNKIVRLDGKKEQAKDLAKALQNAEIAFEAAWPPDNETMMVLVLQYDTMQSTCMMVHKYVAAKYLSYFMPQ